MNVDSGGVIPVLERGHAAGLLDPDEVARIREGDEAYAIRYTGYLDIPFGREGFVLHSLPDSSMTLFRVAPPSGEK